jgi:hypothetical protein
MALNSEQVRNLIAKIDDLPTLPTVITSILEILENPKSTARDIDNVIKWVAGEWDSDAITAVGDDVYFCNTIRYIHKNPEKAFLSKKENYKWSSYNEYLNNNDSLVNIDVLPTCFDKPVLQFSLTGTPTI